MIKLLANDGMDAAGKAILEKHGVVVLTDKVPQEKLAEYIQAENIKVLTVRSATTVRKDLIDHCADLKIIARGGVGMDNIDVEYARSKGILVVNTPAASSNAVAELALAHLFSLARKLQMNNRSLHGGQFNELKKISASGFELKDKTLGLIGLGRIGQALAAKAYGLGMQVIATDPFVSSAEISISLAGKTINTQLSTIPLSELLGKADFISIHVPGGKLISEDEFAMMKDGVCLINTARGGVLDEAALLQAIRSKKVSGAGLDVFENEPAPNPELLNHPAISVSPHIGATTVEAQERIGIELANSILAGLKI